MPIKRGLTKHVMVTEQYLARKGMNSRRGWVSALFHVKPARHGRAQTSRCNACETLGEARVWWQKARLGSPGCRVTGMFGSRSWWQWPGRADLSEFSTVFAPRGWPLLSAAWATVNHTQMFKTRELWKGTWQCLLFLLKSLWTWHLRY